MSRASRSVNLISTFNVDPEPGLDPGADPELDPGPDPLFDPRDDQVEPLDLGDLINLTDPLDLFDLTDYDTLDNLPPLRDDQVTTMGNQSPDTRITLLFNPFDKTVTAKKKAAKAARKLAGAKRFAIPSIVRDLPSKVLQGKILQGKMLQKRSAKAAKKEATENEVAVWLSDLVDDAKDDAKEVGRTDVELSNKSESEGILFRWEPRRSRGEETVPNETSTDVGDAEIASLADFVWDDDMTKQSDDMPEQAPVKKATKDNDERAREKLEKLKKKLSQLDAEMKRERAKLSAVKRKEENRRLFIIGRMVWGEAKKDSLKKIEILDDLDRHLKSDRDRELFELKPRKPGPVEERF